MRIGIIDDEKYFRDILSTQLREFFPNAQIKCYADIIEGIYSQTFDIIFLDIMLRDKKSFDEGQIILDKKITGVLVYISNFDSFVYESYSQKTFFFIRKSKLADDLKIFVSKYTKLEIENRQFITIKYNSQVLNIFEKDIIYIESSRNKITIHTLKTDFSTYISLKHLYEKLDHNFFYRFNGHTIINLNHVLLFNDNDITMNDGRKIFFTRDSKKKFLNVYLDFIEKSM